MKTLFNFLIKPASPQTTQYALVFLRIAIGLLTIPHGIPKIMGGITGWTNLGTTFMFPLGIYFLPTLWGFLGACTEFFGGIALTVGLGTRLASFALTIMMIIALAWHLQRGDSMIAYGLALTLIPIYFTFMIIGSGKFSADSYLNS